MLRDRISSELKDAMKAQDKRRTAVLRMLLSEVNYAQTSADNKLELPDIEVEKVIRSYYKRLNKNLEDFPKGIKTDEIQSEINIVQEYIQTEPSNEQVESAIERALHVHDERQFSVLFKWVLNELGLAGENRIVGERLKTRLMNS